MRSPESTKRCGWVHGRFIPKEGAVYNRFLIEPPRSMCCSLCANERRNAAVLDHLGGTDQVSEAAACALWCPGLCRPNQGVEGHGGREYLYRAQTVQGFG